MAMLNFQDADSLSVSLSVFLIFISLFCEACCQGMIISSPVIMVLYIIAYKTGHLKNYQH